MDPDKLTAYRVIKPLPFPKKWYQKQVFLPVDGFIHEGHSLARSHLLLEAHHRLSIWNPNYVSPTDDMVQERIEKMVREGYIEYDADETKKMIQHQKERASFPWFFAHMPWKGSSSFTLAGPYVKREDLATDYALVEKQQDHVAVRIPFQAKDRNDAFDIAFNHFDNEVHHVIAKMRS